MEASCRGHFLKPFDKCDFDHLQLVMIFWAWPPTSSSDHNWPPNHMLLGSQPGNLPSLKPFLASINHAYPVTPQKTDVCNQQNTYNKNALVTNQRVTAYKLTNLKFRSFKLQKICSSIKKKQAVCCDWLVQL